MATIDSSVDYGHNLDRHLNMTAPLKLGAEPVSISRRSLFASFGLILPAVALTAVGAQAATTNATKHHHHAKHSASKAHKPKHLASSHHHHKAVPPAAS